MEPLFKSDSVFYRIEVRIFSSMVQRPSFGRVLVRHMISCIAHLVLLDFSLTVKAATLIFIFGCASAISSDKVGKSGYI